MNWLKQLFSKFFGSKSERKVFDKSDLEYKDSDNTQFLNTGNPTDPQ